MNGPPPIEPGQTGAVVVGIEAYPHEPGWTIPGAAEEAHLFATWLEDRGVSRVLRLITSDGAHPRPTFAEIRRALFTTAKDWAGDGVRLLFVYWVSHGVLDRRGARLLLCDDAHSRDAQALPFEEYREAMLDRALPPFQVFLVDACAVPRGALGDSRGADPPPPTARDYTRRQFVLYSASRGQASSGLGLDGPSPFPATLRCVLKECGAPWPPEMSKVTAEVKRRLEAADVIQRPQFHSIGWDGDREDPGVTDPAEARGANVDADAVKRLAASLSSLPQLANREGRAAMLRGLSGRMAYGLKADAQEFAERLARNILATPPELGELFEALARDGVGLAWTEVEVRFFRLIDFLLWSPVSWRDVVRLVRLLTVVGPGEEPPIDARTVKRLADDAAGDHPEAGSFTLSALRRPALAVTLLAMLQMDESSQPLLTFAARLAAEVPGPLKAALKVWVDDVARSLDVDPPAVESAVDASEKTACLSVALFPLEDPDTFEVRAWRWDGTRSEPTSEPREVTPADNRKSLAEVTRFVNDRAGRDESLKVEVELFVPTGPLAEGLASWEVNATEDSVLRIDEQYSVTLRSWDRSFGRSRDFNQPARMVWRKRWDLRPDEGKYADEKHVAELYDPCHYDLRTMVREHRLKGPITVAASLAAPRLGGGLDRTLAARVLHNLLVAGMPIAVWPEQGSVGGAGASEIRDRLRAFVMDKPLDKLPDSVYRHQSGEAPGPPAAWRLCLFWDDPGRVPPLVDSHLTQPVNG